MLRSMTGFGNAQGVIEGVEFSVEIRTVNHRYLKILIRLPENLSALEADLEKQLRARLSRGSVMLTLRMKLSDEQAACRVNTAALQSYIEQLKPLEIDATPTLRIDLGTLLQLPGVCEPPAGDLCQRVGSGLLALVAEATEKLLEMRDQEGETIRADLQAQSETIQQRQQAIAERAGGVLQEYHDRLAARVSELTQAAKIKIDEEILAREVAMFAERSDIAEELSRLTSHVQQFGRTMDSPEPAGRKLDFIAQEMLREANTIASKANDAEISAAAVEIKTAVDRIKEQVQNVE